MNVLQRKVLVLNKFWQLLNETTVQDALAQMAAGAAVGVDVIDANSFAPVSWDAWINLPLLDSTECINTASRKVRMPTIIIAINHAEVHPRKMKLTLRNIRKRDGNKCQYTGRMLSYEESSMDHIVPLSRGGQNTPENIALSLKEFNNRKGSKLPEEMGVPRPKPKPLVHRFEPAHPHHEIFIKKKG